MTAEDFEPYRTELLAHCYRMLGSVDEAEDVVQETLLRAWRSYDTFEGRSSLRTWLYRIATNACLNALRSQARRPLPAGLGAPSDDPEHPAPATDGPWLQPIPDALVTPPDADPATIVATRDTLRLAMVASLQLLPPRQRAVLLLRDVLGWSAGEVAETLGTTTTAVKSILQRARTRLDEVSPAADTTAEPTEPEFRALLERYVAAFENSDLAALTELLRADATIQTPPSPSWYAGLATCTAFLGRHAMDNPGDWRSLYTRANGRPAAAVYHLGPDGRYHAAGISVLETTPVQITGIVFFPDPRLFPLFGLPASLSGAELARMEGNAG